MKLNIFSIDIDITRTWAAVAVRGPSFTPPP